MEAAVKSIKSLVSVLPDRPHQLSISPDSRYHLQPNDTRLEEDVIRPLQYMTYLFGVDRGLLLTRAYSDIRDEESYAPRPTKPPTDPNKPRTKVSLQDYKRKKQETTSVDSNTPTPSAKPASRPIEKDRIPAIKKEESPTVDTMLKQSTLKKPHPSLPPKPDVRRPGAEPSPERKKRSSDVHEERTAKRAKIESTPNVLPRSSLKADTPIRASEKSIGGDKKPPKELKPSAMPATNGRSALSNSSSHASPRPSSQVNGSSQKSANGKGSTPKKEKGGSGSKELKSIPMVSPIGPELGSRIPGYELSPRGKPAEKDTKPQPKKHRDELEPSSTQRKLKLELPPLLSPTLPAVVREAQAIADKKFSLTKDSSQKSTLHSDTPSSAKKAPVTSEREDTIYVESRKERKEEPASRIVKLKYPKRIAKTISRLLALAPKKKAEVPRKELLEPPKRDDRTGRERSNSLESAPTMTARKRPRTGTDAGEQPTAIKRPRPSEIAQPSTPSNHPTAMQRVASSSSLAGTPGAINNLTPAAPIPGRRSASVDPERASRLRQQHSTLSGLGTKLKHQRDRIMKPKDGSSVSVNPTLRDRNTVMALDLQSLVSYMAAFKAMDDMRDAERKLREPSLWKSLMPLMRVYRGDCNSSNQLTALIIRLHCIILLWYSRTLVTLGSDNPSNARELFQNAREQEQMWKLASDARKRLDDGKNGDDGGPVAWLIDRLGPWSTSEDVVSVTLKILRKVIRLDDEKFTPEPELIQACEPITNGL